MKVTSLRYLGAKFHHPSLGASPPDRGNRISCVQNSRKMENRNSVNNSGIGILCSKNSNERLAVPAVAGLLVLFLQSSHDAYVQLPILQLWQIDNRIFCGRLIVDARLCPASNKSSVLVTHRD